MIIYIAVIVILSAVIYAQMRHNEFLRETNEYLWFLIRAQSKSAMGMIDELEALEQRNAYLEGCHERQQAIIAQYAPHLVKSVDDAL